MIGSLYSVWFAAYRPSGLGRSELLERVCVGGYPEVDGRVVAVEVKAGQTPKRDWFRWLGRMRDVLGARFVAGVVLYGGQHVLPFGDRLLAAPISAPWEV